MNILLVYPKYPDTFWSFKHVLRFISRKAAFPPLGLVTVAGLLPEAWNKRLVDLNVEELGDEALAWADMVFISAMLVQKESTAEVIRRAKAAGKTVVAGGPAFTSKPDLSEGVDHLVLGEAEVTLPPFLADLEAGRPGAKYDSEEKPDISESPVPVWELIDMKSYATMAVQFSRGCPFNCEFCDIIIMNGRKPRTKPPERMIAEMEALRRAGWRGTVFIVDDNFIGNTRKVKEMLHELIAWQKEHGFPFKFLTEASLNLAQDEELMRLMSAANFHQVFLGIESPSPESLEECGKHQNTVLDLAESVDAIHGNGMQVMGGFIVGFDSDGESIFETQRRFIQKVGVVTAMVGVLNALPGTRLWNRLKAENRLLGESSGENTDGSTNFIPKMGQETLRCGYQRLMASLYSPKQYYRRVNTFLSKYRPTVKADFSRDDLKALLRCFWQIGLKSRSRFLFWKLMLRTACTRIRSLPAAVELAIYGQHFEKHARSIARCEVAEPDAEQSGA
jgi:radical SAM superfamily enzyme YgiQ (UPF0313 family)